MSSKQYALGGLGRGLLWVVLAWVAMSAANALAHELEYYGRIAAEAGIKPE